MVKEDSLFSLQGIRRSELDQRNRKIELISILLNPITLFTFFVIFKSFLMGEEIVHTETERTSYVPYWKLFFYAFFPNLTLLLSGYFTFFQYLLLWFSFPSDFLIMYIIYSYQIEFSGFRYVLYLVFQLFFFIKFVLVILETASISVEEIVASRVMRNIPQSNGSSFLNTFSPSPLRSLSIA